MFGTPKYRDRKEGTDTEKRACSQGQRERQHQLVTVLSWWGECGGQSRLRQRGIAKVPHPALIDRGLPQFRHSLLQFLMVISAPSPTHGRSVGSSHVKSCSFLSLLPRHREEKIMFAYWYCPGVSCLRCCWASCFAVCCSELCR